MREYKPTRHNLLEVREQRAFAERGHELLRRKRDALVLEFMDVLHRAEASYDDANAAFERLFPRFERLWAFEGRVALETLAWTRHAHPSVTVETKNVMGVTVPHFEALDVRVDVDKLGYGLLGTSPAIDEVVLAYEALLERIVTVAEHESALRRLLAEIKLTMRRVNALENVLIPDLRANEEYIERHTAEREREEIIIKKWIKDRKHGSLREHSVTE